jgi:urease accessory protein
MRLSTPPMLVVMSAPSDLLRTGDNAAPEPGVLYADLQSGRLREVKSDRLETACACATTMRRGGVRRAVPLMRRSCAGARERRATHRSFESVIMGWHGHLQLHYRCDGERTVAHDRHDGPLRVLKALHPEGPAVCHHVLVHPPGGIVGGDRLDVTLRVDGGAHALVTTPGATRFYRSAGEPAVQDVHATVAGGGRLEWLPLETIAYAGCRAENRLRFELADGAEMIGCDLLALGLPAADEAFGRGEVLQHLEVPGRWLERGRIAADDRRLLDGPLGFAGQRVLATLWFAAGTPIEAVRREALLEAARGGNASATLPQGATAPNDHVVVRRLLAPRVEPALARVREAWAAWRWLVWQREARPPRVWRT